MRLLSGLLFTVVLVFGISFSVLNSAPAVIHYYVGTKEMPLSLLILIILILGIVIGLLAALPTVLKLKMDIRRFAVSMHNKIH